MPSGSARDPFIGRALELEVLDEAWATARSGARPLIVVKGEAASARQRS